MRHDSAPGTDDSDISRARGPRVITCYSSGYRLPFDVLTVVERMVASVPPKYLVGLREIVLTDQSELPRKRRRSVAYSRKKKVRIMNTCGLYHPAWKGERARIEIFVDATLQPWKNGIWLKIPFLREAALGEVVFHEIGHHIHDSVRPEYREQEDVADVWQVRLHRNYARNRFGLLRLIFRICRLVAGPLLDRLHLKLAKRELQQGRMSQAEFEESTRAAPRK